MVMRSKSYQAGSGGVKIETDFNRESKSESAGPQREEKRERGGHRWGLCFFFPKEKEHYGEEIKITGFMA